ncbi:hypothetical protein LA080_013361 [Diaporthe eres]|nr:hypothetical protein LA080_013361 [Diaporthe eres]
MEYSRFYIWAKVSRVFAEEPSSQLRVNSSTTPGPPAQHDDLTTAPIHSATARFVDILEDISIIAAKYKLNPAENMNLDGTASQVTTLSSRLPVLSGSSNSALSASISKQGEFVWNLQKRTSFRRRFTFASKPWGRPDREELKSKIAELCYWNDRLEGLLPRDVRLSLASQAAPCQMLIDENKEVLQHLIDVPEPLGEPVREHARLWKEHTAVSELSADDVADLNRLTGTYRREITCLDTVTGVSHASMLQSAVFEKVYGEETRGRQVIWSVSTSPSLAVVEWYSYPSSMETSEELRRASNRLAGLPVSLFSLIQRKGEAASDLRPPPLEARIRLSQQLAGSLHSFGLARWFHKDFNCRNIVFFRSKLVPSSVMLESPYITGFSISRPDAPNEVSLNKDHEDLSVYLHPDLRTGDHSARPKYGSKYDVYSLGLVLLEIGLWRTLTPMIDSDLSPAEFKSQATRRCQRDLAFFTGSGFRDIVMRCLTCADEGSDETASSLDNFYFSVVLELVKLFNTSGS